MSIAQARLAYATGHARSAVPLRLVADTVAGVEQMAGVDYRDRLGRTIAEVRVLMGMSQEQLAQALNRSTAALSRWENGKAEPSAHDLHRLAVILDMPADMLIYPSEVPPTPTELRLRHAVEAGLRTAEIRDRRARRSGLGRGGRPRKPPAGGRP